MPFYPEQFHNKQPNWDRHTTGRYASPACMSADRLELKAHALDEIEHNTHSFIVRVWREQTGARQGEFAWRGRIIHVPDGSSRSVQFLSEIGLFVALYLAQLGVRLGFEYYVLRLLLTLQQRSRQRPQTRK